MGVYQGRVVKLDDDFVYTEIPDLGVDQEFPCRYTIKKPDINDNVLVLNINGALEDLVVVGSLQKEITTGGGGSGGILVDTDGVPYYELGGDILEDTDGVPYYA